MKKAILLLILITFISCSSDESSSASSNSSLHPPAWIQGTWGVDSTEMYKFSNNDFCQGSSSMEICWNETIKLSQSSGSTNKLNDVTTDDTYEVIISTAAVTMRLKFKKVNATTILWLNDNGPEGIELTKIK